MTSMDVLVLRACWPLAALMLGRLLALVAFALLARKTRSYDDDEIHGDSSHARRAILPAYRPFLLGMLVALGVLVALDVGVGLVLAADVAGRDAHSDHAESFFMHAHEVSQIANLALYSIVPAMLAHAAVVPFARVLRALAPPALGYAGAFFALRAAGRALAGAWRAPAATACVFGACLLVLVAGPVAGHVALLTGAAPSRMQRSSRNHVAAVVFALCATAAWAASTLAVFVARLAIFGANAAAESTWYARARSPSAPRRRGRARARSARALRARALRALRARLA